MSTAAASTKASAVTATTQPPDFKAVLEKAAQRSLGGGLSGAAAMGIQVFSLMWLRTTVNYQYKNGTSTTTALRTLYAQGGIPRFYRGLLPALFQGPLSRFGDTAANTGVLALLNGLEETKNLSVGVKTLAASFTAGIWRIGLMPIDTLKTTLQVNGSDGMKLLKHKIRTNGIGTLYHGALAASTATFVGHYPWFFTYNFLQENLPTPANPTLLKKMSRNAFIGFVSSAVSDTISNSVRVVKTYRQTHDIVISYPQAVKDVVARDGWVGLFGRGLKTKIISNGIQGLLFSVLWKFFEDQFNTNPKK
ncbi:mitochondrial carrier domain-containing protein [Paraphysoderma sedebokerense]|nr:mitochondrial carrier domain-containing protein [Paraphysoderma sedebokerense]